MPSVDEMLAKWDGPGGWTDGGDEWSGPWGGTDAMWWGTLRPRLAQLVPTGKILELGPLVAGREHHRRLVARRCEAAGLAFLGQELICWQHGGFLTDAITLLTPRGSSRRRPPVVVRNRHFMDEARSAAARAPLYAASPRSAGADGPS